MLTLLITNQFLAPKVGRTTVTRISTNKPVQPEPTKTVTRIITRPPGRQFGRKQGSDDDDGLAEMFAGKEGKKSAAPGSPERPMTLCPFTGAVLGKAEGEKTPPIEEEIKIEEEQIVEQTPGVAVSGGEGDTQISQIMTNEDGSPLLVTGEDGTIYQVAGKNAEGQTILIAQGADGEQQCLFVAADETQEGSMQVAAEGVVVEGQEQVGQGTKVEVSV